jgi:hypothetical protein
MRKITLLLAFVACIFFAKAQLLLTENFEYTAGSNLLGQGSWALTGTAASPVIQVTATSISYSGYPGSGVGNEITLTNGEDLNKVFAEQTTGTVYVSFLVNVSAAPAAGDYFIHVGSTVMGSAYIGRTFVKADAATAGKIVFGIMQASSGTQTYTTTTYDLNTTYLVVLKHDIAGKTSSIIVNPTLNAEPTTGWISNNTGTNATTNIGSVGVRQPSPSAALTAKLDGIRVATSYAALFTSTGTSNPSVKSFSAIVSGKNLLLNNVANGSTVEIYSALGSKIQTSVIENGKVGLSNLTRGMYVVRVNNMTQKIMF